jgi:DNA topoisomerase-1
MKKLLIVESPSKIKTISKFLGKDFVILSTLGHIKDLPSKKIGITIDEHSIDLEYEAIKGKQKTITEIVQAAKRSDTIYLAPDPDREGEIIAWHVEQEIKKYVKPENIHRISFNEITKPAVLKAIENTSVVDLKMVAAQQARRVLDRWVGYEVSPILWRKIAKGLSAGRVQSVALRLVCEREKSIRAFKPEEFWSITGLFDFKKERFEAPLSHISNKVIKIKNEKQAQEIVAEISKETAVIEKIVDKKRLQKPVAPLITSSLQQAGANRLGFSVKKTMDIAQKMYEGVPLQNPQEPVALITYMRTDSTRLSETAITQARDYIASEYGAKYLPSSPNLYAKTGSAQDAHEAIRPVDIAVTPQSIKPYVAKEMYNLYNLIWSRTIACQMTPAQYAQRQVVITAGKYTFSVTGSTLLFDGFLKAYEEDKPEESEEKVPKIPGSITESSAIHLAQTTPKQHFTKAPPRFNEASLVKELKEQGIGRPSTYATILTTILSRQYVESEKRRFTPTDLGMKVSDMLSENFSKIMNVAFTAHLEEDLDKVAQGEMERDVLLREFWEPFSADLAKFKDSKQELGRKTTEVTEIDCPTCKKNKLLIRMSKSGSFLGCSGFPECTFTSKFKRDERGAIEFVETEQPTLLDETCEKCTAPLRKMIGRYGEFVSCSGYPKCKFIKQNAAWFPCPTCDGKVIERKWRGGTLWGCEKYPKCTFSIFSDIINENCPKCKSVQYMTKKPTKAGTAIICPNQSCKHAYTQEPNE